MISAGIEAMNVFGGSAHLNVEQLARHRRLDTTRFENLLMKEKTVALPFEDPVTFAVNAASRLVDELSAKEKERIELLITCSESGIDFGKSISTYVHHYLQLNRNCRLFEIKQACYAATAGLQMATNFILAQTSPGAKALVVATDISRFVLPEGSQAALQDWSYAELSAGAGAVAMLVGSEPHVLELDVGANGYYGYEVMDTCRPVPDSDTGDPDLSLLSYLDCCEQAFLEYQRRVQNVDYRSSFQHLVFHVPFGGMVKGAHRTMMRRFGKAMPSEIDADFQSRVLPGMIYCQRVGNIMGGTIFLSLASTIDHCQITSPRRIGCFSYGSGCCSEFYSGIATSAGQKRQRHFAIEQELDCRYPLSIEDYEEMLRASERVKFGTRDVELDAHMIPGVLALCTGKKRLFLSRIKGFHREYRWNA
jgi:polyketide biosynthesis 3-hydroxy-3-methylglutaryl-CoA synthase-like enzyme PksG